MISHVQKIVTYALHSQTSMHLFHPSEHSMKSLRYRDRWVVEGRRGATCISSLASNGERKSIDFKPVPYTTCNDKEKIRVEGKFTLVIDNSYNERSAHEPSLRKQHIDIASTSDDGSGTTGGKRSATCLLLSLSSRKRREARTRKEGHRCKDCDATHVNRNKEERVEETSHLLVKKEAYRISQYPRYVNHIEFVWKHKSISEYTLYIPSAVLLSSRMLGNVATLYESERPCCKKWAIKKS
ncbi:hypothetical protein ALC60_09405 [Trachymyrmex zeteki]|uniref:Uncharacterized protein n=1 Tax=Mycetomoellerius zeteki TaxID=64791 RepID=A0A151WUB6_9HYME|nr:hypothetical protein ALC60_09405 [Trachymyrmex zeteki]